MGLEGVQSRRLSAELKTFGTSSQPNRFGWCHRARLCRAAQTIGSQRLSPLRMDFVPSPQRAANLSLDSASPIGSNTVL